MVLGIYGASGMGREILETVRTINKADSKYEKIVFVDDNPELVSVQNVEVISLDKAYGSYEKELTLVLAIGEPATRRKVIERVESMGISFETVVYPGTAIPESTVMGKGCYIGPGCFISCNVTIGDYVLVQPSVNIGHDCVVEDNAVLSSLTCLAGNCHIGHDSYLAMNVTAIQGSKVGADSIVGMASVIQRDIPDEVIAMGNPARAMRRNEEHKVFK